PEGTRKRHGAQLGGANPSSRLRSPGAPWQTRHVRAPSTERSAASAYVRPLSLQVITLRPESASTWKVSLPEWTVSRPDGLAAGSDATSSEIGRPPMRYAT